MVCSERDERDPVIPGNAELPGAHIETPAAWQERNNIMSFRHKLVSTLGIAAIGISLTSGMALAQTTDMDETVVNVTCPYTASVDVESAAFSINTAGGQQSATIADGVTVKLDLTCNWSNDFQVGASIGAFDYVGTAPSGSAQSFGGSHFLLTSGSGVYAGPNVPLITAAPEVEATVFESFQISDPTVIINDSFLFLDYAAPGVTTATWDSNLALLPLNLAGGAYIAPLTVTLTVN